MTLIYLDSSAVIKIFVDEAYTREVRTVLSAGETTCVTSDLTYSEIHGWLSRAYALGRIDATRQKALLGRFHAWFDQISHAGLPFARIQRAGQLAIRHNLRGADAIHLVTAIERVGTTYGERRVFACFDERLTREAAGLGVFDDFLTDPAWI